MAYRLIDHQVTNADTAAAEVTIHYTNGAPNPKTGTLWGLHQVDPKTNTSDARLQGKITNVTFSRNDGREAMLLINDYQVWPPGVNPRWKHLVVLAEALQDTATRLLAALSHEFSEREERR